MAFVNSCVLLKFLHRRFLRPKIPAAYICRQYEPIALGPISCVKGFMTLVTDKSNMRRLLWSYFMLLVSFVSKDIACRQQKSCLADLPQSAKGLKTTELLCG